jgi:sulfatase modifying factor 1
MLLLKRLLRLLSPIVPLLFALSALAAGPAGMRWIPPGDFARGSDESYAMPNECPAAQVHIDGFWIDEHDVTNAEFRRFVESTSYVTTAERPVDWEAMKKQLPAGTPKPPDEMLTPGALVFVPPDHPVALDDLSVWWRWTPGANWRHPQGPGSDIVGKDDVPVVQVSWFDAMAYAKWAGKRLPSENEWEYAAWGGQQASGRRYYWGNQFRSPDGTFHCNTFTGTFPNHDTGEDHFTGPSPVNAFPPNGFGLRDAAGNVWQWTADAYVDRRDNSVPTPQSSAACCDVGSTTDDSTIQRVVKGGSFLCSESYCESYRPSARRGVTPDTASVHTGFRCAVSASQVQMVRVDRNLER